MPLPQLEDTAAGTEEEHRAHQQGLVGHKLFSPWLLLEYHSTSFHSKWISAKLNRGAKLCPGTAGSVHLLISTLQTLQVAFKAQTPPFSLFLS